MRNKIVLSLQYLNTIKYLMIISYVGLDDYLSVILVFELQLATRAIFQL